MSVPAQVRSQGDAADALLQRLLNPTPGDPSQQPTAAQPGQPQGEASNGSATDWKAEYDRLAAANRVLQGKYNAEVPRLNAQLHALQAEVEGLKKAQGGAPGAAAAKPAKTPPDMSKFDNEIIELVEHMTGAATQPLQQELEQRRARDAEQDRKAADDNAYTAMLNKLDRLVPNWKAVNDSPAFQAWCGEVDPASGQLRQVELGDAVNRRDAADVAVVFGDFLAANPQGGRTQQAPGNRLAEQQVPSKAGSAASDPGGGKQTWTRDQVRQFYQLKAQGKLKHIPAEKLAAIEADIYSAPAEGRVRD